MAGEHKGSSHDDGDLGGKTCPGAPTRRGEAGLRLDGQHTGKLRVSVACLDVVGLALEAYKEGGKKGRWLRRRSHQVDDVVVASSG
jgi:hypothetical protein